MNASQTILDNLADIMSAGGVGHLRQHRMGGDPAFWHDLALSLFAAGRHGEMRAALDEYRDTFCPVAIREPYAFGRIGEGAAAFGTLAHLRRMGRLSVSPVLLCDQGAANPAYIRHWQAHFPLVTSEAEMHERYGDIPTMRVGFLPTPEGAFAHVGDAYAMARMMDDVPLLSLSDEEIEAGRAALAGLGMPKGAWFVCLHARSPVYMASAGVDDTHNAYRNSDVRTFAKAAHQIAERGGWVVRIGAPGVERLPPWPNTIDLPHRRPWADWLDLFVMGGCRFFLGDSSGPVAVAATFGRPVVGVNLQLGTPSIWMALHMPKLYRRGGKVLTLAESVKVGMFMRQRPVPDGIEVVDNTAEEIERAVVEYMDGAAVDYVRQQLYLNAFPIEAVRVLGHVSPSFLGKHDEALR